MALLPGSPALGTGGPLTSLDASATTVNVGDAFTIARTAGSYLIQVDAEQMLVSAVRTDGRSAGRKQPSPRGVRVLEEAGRLCRARGWSMETRERACRVWRACSPGRVG